MPGYQVHNRRASIRNLYHPILLIIFHNQNTRVINVNLLMPELILGMPGRFLSMPGTVFGLQEQIFG